ncbi:MAG: hypothetical protein SRB1_01262 [Desulfobacteraceae bacterium Eth-SRB1]|nr:MAG: hypothetical protein SRB1_01262 [Desulfobacteraceae bacterium Eth-SRB1]
MSHSEIFYNLFNDFFIDNCFDSLISNFIVNYSEGGVVGAVWVGHIHTKPTGDGVCAFVTSMRIPPVESSGASRDVTLHNHDIVWRYL